MENQTLEAIKKEAKPHHYAEYFEISEDDAVLWCEDPSITFDPRNPEDGYDFLCFVRNKLF